MKINDDEYKKLLEAYMKEQYDSLKTKPNGMMGHWGFHAVKSREFKERMIKEGRIGNEKLQVSD